MHEHAAPVSVVPLIRGTQASLNGHDASGAVPSHEQRGGDMAYVPPQRTADDPADPEQLIARLSADLERAIAFAEECRWRFPELRAEADELAAGAMALFGKAVKSMHADPARHG
jgi:hypothetical protein